MRAKKVLMIILLTCVGLFPTLLWAGALKMENYSRILVENLQIGEKYSMIQLVNLPLKVINDSDEAIVLAVDVIKPQAKFTREGFEAIPDTAWVSVANSIAAVAEYGTFLSDVMISIPNKKEYLGKKYQVDLRARILPSGSFAAVSLAINGHLSFTVAPVKLAQPLPGKAGNLAYAMSPERVELKNIPVGKSVEVVTDAGIAVKLQNNSDQKSVFIPFSLDPVKAAVRIEADAEPVPDPNFLTFEKEEITLNPQEAKPLRMYVKFPDKPEYRGKRFQFAISVRSGENSDVTRYMRVLVSTAK
jgi:hypothetical protein